MVSNAAFGVDGCVGADVDISTDEGVTVDACSGRDDAEVTEGRIVSEKGLGIDDAVAANLDVWTEDGSSCDCCTFFDKNGLGAHD